jgi:hypothetical protein
LYLLIPHPISGMLCSLLRLLRHPPLLHHPAGLLRTAAEGAARFRSMRFIDAARTDFLFVFCDFCSACTVNSEESEIFVA